MKRVKRCHTHHGKSVHVVHAGSGERHLEHRYRSRVPVLWWVSMSRSWIRVPNNAFLIEHRDGPVLFDTGLDPAMASDLCACCRESIWVSLKCLDPMDFPKASPRRI